jgi:carbonic anhydrase
LESIEFGVKKLKAPLLIMLGHDDCGVTKFAKDYYSENKESYTSIMSNLCPIIEEQGHLHYDEITKEHTQTLKKLLIERSVIINEAVKNGDLTIISAHFHFDTGKISLL